MPTDIEWADETWNPIVGCSRITEGCDHCYAIGVVHRAMSIQHVGLTVKPEGKPVDWNGEVGLAPIDRIHLPLRWHKPRRVFVNSLSDLFHEHVSYETAARIFAVMACTPQHTYQVLTKRPQRMAKALADPYFHQLVAAKTLQHVDTEITTWPLPNVWLGTSIELDKYAFRADHLRATPAAVRFVSAEPLLGPLPSLDLTGIDWLIVGGESGPGSRPMHPDWVRDLRDRCADVTTGSPAQFGTSFFFKQWGAWVPYEPDVQPPFWNSQHGDTIDSHHLPATLSDGDVVGGWLADLDPESGDAIYRRVGKYDAGRVLDGRTWDEYPAAVTP